MTEPKRNTCPVCGSSDVLEFIRIPEVPIFCNRLWQTRETALAAPKGDLILAFCNACTHIFNKAFEPQLVEYSPGYENTLHFSDRFQKYAESLARRLIEQYGLKSKTIIEIGCGDGKFLATLCEIGSNIGIGFDPSYKEESEIAIKSGGISIIKDYYSEKYSEYHADLICTRHVLEHIHEPVKFVSSIRETIGGKLDTVVFFEVPNVMYTLRDFGIWDLIYEHPNYFNSVSLRKLFSICGFKIVHLREDFGGQYLCLEALPGDVPEDVKAFDDPYIQKMAKLVHQFSEKYKKKRKQWKDTLNELSNTTQRIVLWGAGSKGITFLNVLGIREQIRYVVDINPRKQDMFVPVTGQQVVTLKFLLEFKPDVAIVMNPVYADEIRTSLDKLGLECELYLV